MTKNKVREFAKEHYIKLALFANALDIVQPVLTRKLDADDFSFEEKRKILRAINTIPHISDWRELFPED